MNTLFRQLIDKYLRGHVGPAQDEVGPLPNVGHPHPPPMPLPAASEPRFNPPSMPTRGIMANSVPAAMGQIGTHIGRPTINPTIPPSMMDKPPLGPPPPMMASHGPSPKLPPMSMGRSGGPPPLTPLDTNRLPESNQNGPLRPTRPDTSTGKGFDSVHLPDARQFTSNVKVSGSGVPSPPRPNPLDTNRLPESNQFGPMRPTRPDTSTDKGYRSVHLPDDRQFTSNVKISGPGAPPPPPMAMPAQAPITAPGPDPSSSVAGSGLPPVPKPPMPPPRPMSTPGSPLMGPDPMGGIQGPDNIAPPEPLESSPTTPMMSDLPTGPAPQMNVHGPAEQLGGGNDDLISLIKKLLHKGG